MEFIQQFGWWLVVISVVVFIIFMMIATLSQQLARTNHLLDQINSSIAGTKNSVDEIRKKLYS